jgi:hypothetical protein
MKVEVVETKIARLMRIIEDNIEAEIRAERECAASAWEYPLRGLPVIPRGPDRKLEKALLKQLSAEERMELSRRKKVKARECWEQGDDWRKSLWGGW